MLLAILLSQSGLRTSDWLPTSYVCNIQPHTLQRALSETSEVVLGKFEDRREVNPQRLDRESGPPFATYIDTFQSTLGARKFLVFTGHIRPEQTEALADRPFYLVGLGVIPKNRVLILPISSAMKSPIVRFRGEADWVPGTFCWPLRAASLTRTSMEKPEKGSRGTIRIAVSGLADLLIEAKSEPEVHRVCTLILNWNISKWQETGHFGEEGEWLSSNWEGPVRKSTLKVSDKLRAQILGMCSLLPGSNAGEERFNVLVKLANQGAWPAYLDGGNLTESSNKLVRAADRFARHREFFYSHMRNAPDDAGVRMMVGWLDKAKPSFAMALFKKLAYWAQRFDLEPKVAPQYLNGQPVLENRDELTRIWKENPPPIKVRGG